MVTDQINQPSQGRCVAVPGDGDVSSQLRSRKSRIALLKRTPDGLKRKLGLIAVDRGRVCDIRRLIQNEAI